MIGISFGIVLLLKNYQVILRKENAEEFGIEKGLTFESIKLYLTSMMVSTCLVLINYGLNAIMKFFCKIERHTSTTTFNLSFVKKLVRVQLINSCALIIISHLILIDDKKFIWLEGGLLYDAFFLMLSKVMMFAISPLLSFNQYKKWYKRWRLKKDPKKSSLLQYEANEVFTGSSIHLGSAFGSAIQTYYVCIFFMPILPSAGLLLLVGILILHYS